MAQKTGEEVAAHPQYISRLQLSKARRRWAIQLSSASERNASASAWRRWRQTSVWRHWKGSLSSANPVQATWLANGEKACGMTLYSASGVVKEDY